MMSARPMKHVYSSSVPVRWGDMDAYGHVNNTNYFRYMEQVRVEWMDSVKKRSVSEVSPEGTGPVLINAQCTFLRQLKYTDLIEVRMFVGAVGRSSFETRYEIYKCSPESAEEETMILCAEGTAKIVWVNYVEEKSVPLPELVRAQF